MSNFTEAATITFGDVAENHVGMQKVGIMSQNGFFLEDLLKIILWCNNNNTKYSLIDLTEYLPELEKNKQELKAYVLHIKNGVNKFMNDNTYSNKLFEEQNKLEKDKKAFMYGRVVNKHARHNLCFGEEDQEPNYEEGKGRVYGFNNIQYLSNIRNKLEEIIGEKAKQLQAEGNYYFDTNKCGIGYHGDAERKKVIAIRLGKIIPLTYIWYKNNEAQSNIIEIKNIEHGDIYIMSEKATGFDWKKKSIYTLRHAAGSEKYTRFS